MSKHIDDMGDLRGLPGMDAELARILVSQLQVRNRAELKRALEAGRLAGLRGFSRQLKWRLQAALAAEPPRGATRPRL